MTNNQTMTKREAILLIILVCFTVISLVWLSHKTPIDKGLKNEHQLDSIINVNTGRNKEILQQQVELSAKLTDLQNQKTQIQHTYHEKIRIIEHTIVADIPKATDSLFNYLSKLDKDGYFDPIPIAVD